jgi:hypothetical protein
MKYKVYKAPKGYCYENVHTKDKSTTVAIPNGATLSDFYKKIKEATQ